MRRKNKLSLTQRKGLTGFLFTLPWFIGFVWFIAKSVLSTIWFSFNELNMDSGKGYQLSFIGLDNYEFALFKDATFNRLLVNSLGDILVDVPLIIFFSLFIAIILNSKMKGRAVIRAIFFLPIILNAGAINDALELARIAASGGIDAVASEVASSSGLNIDYMLNVFMELGLSKTIIEYLMVAINRIYDIVKASGVQIIIFLASLQAISGSLYEVAKIEGATAYETFWKVTLPMVSPLILTNVVYTIIDSFTDSEVVEKAYTMAFTNYEWGVSAAMSIMATLVVSVVLVVVGIFLSKNTFYHN